MKYGLSDAQQAEINAVLSQYADIERAILFGSRAMDTFKEASDVDIAIKGKSVTATLAAKVKGHLEDDTNQPFFFDVLAYDAVKSEDVKRHIRRKGKVIYCRGWESHKLGEIAKIGTGNRNAEDASINGIYPLFDRSQVVKKSNQFLFDDEAIIVAGEGQQFHPRYYSGKFDLHQRAYAIYGMKKHTNAKYLYYFIGNGKKYFESVAVGSTVLSLRLNHFQDFPIAIPPLSEQKAIAEVLSSLDDKIDLLHRQNKTLEQMAETLFRQWFVEEAADDWDTAILGDFVSISSGIGIKKDKLDKNGEVPVCGANGEIGRTNDFLYKEELIYTGRVGTLGKIFRVDGQKIWLTDNTLIIKPINYFNFFYLFLKRAQLENLNAGSTQPLVRKSDVMKIEFAIPNKEIFSLLEEHANAYFEKIKENMLQIQTLQSLRDTLLPKLMSGEVQVA